MMKFILQLCFLSFLINFEYILLNFNIIFYFYFFKQSNSNERKFRIVEVFPVPGGPWTKWIPFIEETNYLIVCSCELLLVLIIKSIIFPSITSILFLFVSSLSLDWGLIIFFWWIEYPTWNIPAIARMEVTTGQIS